MNEPLGEKHCRAAMPGHPSVLCGRHRGHDTERGDTGHRQRSADGGMRWPSEESQAGKAESFVLWLRDQRAAAVASCDAKRAVDIAVLVSMTERLFLGGGT